VLIYPKLGKDKRLGHFPYKLVKFMGCCSRILIFICLLGLFSESFATVDIADKNRALIKLQSKIKLVTADINALQDKQTILLNELKELDLRYGKNSLHLQQLTAAVDRLQVDLKQVNQTIEQKQRQINAQKSGLAEQVRATYAIGKNGSLKLILNQQNVWLSERMIHYYRYLSRARLNKITRIAADVNALQALKARKEKKTHLLTDALAKAKQGRINLALTRSERQALLKKIKQRFSSKQQQLNQFKRAERKLKSLILSLQKVMKDFPYEEGRVKKFSQLKGQLPWPVTGRLIKKFATRRADSQWDGVLIQAREGSKIHAVTRGRVVYADWLRGSGLLTIIDHGQGFMTLYAFSQSLFKTVGDWVDPGTVIATVGTSGGQSKSGLYFGIRKKGQPVNPEKWCQKIRRGRVRFKQ